MEANSIAGLSGGEKKATALTDRAVDKHNPEFTTQGLFRKVHRSHSKTNHDLTVYFSSFKVS